jgi:hypothetical protein
LRKSFTRYCNERFDRIGSDSIVEIDEIVISRRKYNIGRVTKLQWIFGCIERATNNFCLRLIDNQGKDVLESVIRECIIEYSVVHSDCWSSYMYLFANTSDYKHYPVNHGKDFVDPVTKAHTQSIESLWSRLKCSLRSKGLTDYNYLSDYLGEFTFRIKTKKFPAVHFFYLLVDISK